VNIPSIQPTDLSEQKRLREAPIALASQNAIGIESEMEWSGVKWPAAESIIAQLLSLVDLCLSPIESSDLISIFAFVCEIQTLFASGFDRITQ
jgi:hypothetical protein